MINNKLKIFFTILFIFITLLSIQNVSAHPPSKLNLYYNEDDSQLIVNITHVVSNSDHFIESVEVKINDEEFDTYTYNSQSDNSMISLLYDISANNGDVIEVKAICNQFGTLTKDLTVGQDNGGSSTPGFTFIIILIMIICFIVFYRKK